MNVRAIMIAVLASFALGACGNSEVKKFQQVWTTYTGSGEHTLEVFKDKTCVLETEGNRIPCEWTRLDDGRFKITLTNTGFRPVTSPVGIARLVYDGLYVTTLGELQSAEFVGPDLAPAKAAYQKVSDAPNRLEALIGAANEGSVEAMNSAAWSMAVMPENLDGPNAVFYAAKAVDYAEKRLAFSRDAFDAVRLARAIDTLAAAQARNGEIKKAVSTQKKAIELLEDVSEIGSGAKYEASYREDFVRPTPWTLWTYKDHLAAYEDGEAVLKQNAHGDWIQAPDFRLRIDGKDLSATYPFGRNGQSRWSGSIQWFGDRTYIIILHNSDQVALAWLSRRNGCNASKIVMSDPLVEFDQGYAANHAWTFFHSSFYPTPLEEQCLYDINIDARTVSIATPADAYEAEEYTPYLEASAAEGNTHAMELLLYRYAFAPGRTQPGDAGRILGILVPALEQQEISKRDWPWYAMANAAAVSGDFSKAKTYLERGLGYDEHLRGGILAAHDGNADGAYGRLERLYADKIAFYSSWSDLFKAGRAYDVP